MNKLRYETLMSPVRIGGVVLKNRLIATPHDIHFSQGNGPYPSEEIINWYINKAKNGCALVNVGCIAVGHTDDHGHGYTWDVEDGHVQHYLAQISDGIHMFGSKASSFFRCGLKPGYDISTGKPTHWTYGDGSKPSYDCVEAPAEMLEEFADKFSDYAYILKHECGFDGIFIHMAYRASIFARSISPLINDRNDKYGGSLENRFRLPLLCAKLIKEKCGKDFLVEGSISGEESPGGTTIDDVIEMAKMAEGKFDIFTLKSGEIDPAHCTQFQEDNPWLYMSEAVKKGKPKVMIATSGGYQDPEVCEQILKEGKADLIGMARPWICDPEYGRKVYEGRTDDIVPCVRCNKCHKASYATPWSPYCTVNPLFGWENRIPHLFQPAGEKKKVAVIGGGPSGMEAALIAAQRGHSVTIYERMPFLGGQLWVTKDVSFKKPLQRYREYLIRQVEKANIDLRLCTVPTVEMLNAEDYDAVIAAVGAQPNMPTLPGIDRENVCDALYAFVHPQNIAKKVVIIGGGEVGTEAGVYFAQNGHDVTVIEMKDRLADDATPVHYYSIFEDTWRTLDNFTEIVKARCTGIDDRGVSYLDENGREHIVGADTVIVSAGMRAKTDEALSYRNTAKRFFMVGDCSKVGNVNTALRTGLGAAAMI